MRMRTEVRAEAGDDGDSKEADTRSDDAHLGLFLGLGLRRSVGFIGYTT